MTTSTLVTVGGSEIGAVCGLDPWLDATTLAARKLGLIPEPPETEAMKLGKRLEPIVAELAAERGYQVVAASGETEHDPERRWCVGRPDGFTVVAERPAVAELKTVGQLAARAGWDAGPPLHYQAQCQWYMHLTGLNDAAVFALVGGQRFDVYELERDDDAIGALLEAAEAFVKLVRRGRLPAPDGSDTARSTLTYLYPEHAAGTIVRASKLDVETFHELRLTHEAQEQLKTRRTHLENTLKMSLGDAETMLSPSDVPMVHWRSLRYARLNGTRLKEAHPELHSEFSDVTITRRFTLA